MPTSGEVAIRGGKFQDFQNGAILWSAATGAQVSPKGDIRTAYQRAGFEAGVLGFPTSGEVSIPGGKYQNFQNGAILWSAATGAQVSANGPIRSAYQGAGFEAGILGFPTTGEIAIRGGGKYQNFQNGAILWSAATGAQVSPNGAIRTAYQAAGFEGGRLGYPTSGVYVLNGLSVQDFQGGRITLERGGNTTVRYN